MKNIKKSYTLFCNHCDEPMQLEDEEYHIILAFNSPGEVYDFIKKRNYKGETGKAPKVGELTISY